MKARIFQALLCLGALAIYSCSKHDEALSDLQPSPMKLGGAVTTDYNKSTLSSSDQLLINLSKVVAYKWNNEPSFKNTVSSKLFDEYGNTRTVFVDEVLPFSQASIGLLTNTGLSSTEYNGIFETMNGSCSDLVLKVPRWTEAYWKDEENKLIEFSQENIKSLDFVFYPRLGETPTDETWRGYKYDAGGTEAIQFLSATSYPQNHIPIVVRHSDTHVFINTSDFKGKNGRVMINQDASLIPASAPCHPLQVIQNHTVKNCGDGYVLVDYIPFMNDLANKCDEICGNHQDDDYDGLVDEEKCIGGVPPPLAEDCSNGFDDDNDGLVDCDDPDCCGIASCVCSEICENGLDDDGDGKIDAADPDCCKHFAQCCRDCRVDASFIKSAKFVDQSIIPVLSGAPSFDDAINLRLIFNQFNGTGNAAVANEKQIPGFLLGYCTKPVDYYNSNGQHVYVGECDLAANYFFGVKVWTTSLMPPGAIIIGSFVRAGTTFYVFVNGSIDRVLNVKWLGEWNGALYGGNAIRCKVIASNAEVVNQSGSSSVTVTENVSTTIGNQSGAGGQNSQGQNQGSGGWSFSSQGGTTVTYTSQISYTSNTAGEEPLGTVDFEYCLPNDRPDQICYNRGLPLTVCKETAPGSPNTSCNLVTWDTFLEMLQNHTRYPGGVQLSTGSLTLNTSTESTN